MAHLIKPSIQPATTLPTKFKLYPMVGKGHYFEVVIYPSLFLFMKKVQQEWGDSTVACTTTFNEKKNKKGIRKVGKIELYPDSLTPDIIAHELDHAVTGYMDCFLNLSLIKSETPVDEQRAQMVGRLHSQFWSLLVC